jgi:tRNA(Arg) A34 adenosine deaminase TadA
MDDVELLSQLLTVIEQNILPKTRASVVQGNKIFGAAILKKSDLSVIIAETNNEVENPLWHGEMHAIKKLYETEDRSNLPDPKDCIFLATHEPCSLCLSAITWGGYGNFYYLFSHENSRDNFNIPHDIRILNEVFGNAESTRPLYNRINAFWHSHSITEMIDNLDKHSPDRESLLGRVNKLIALYTELSAAYQTNKGNTRIPLA